MMNDWKSLGNISIMCKQSYFKITNSICIYEDTFCLYCNYKDVKICIYKLIFNGLFLQYNNYVNMYLSYNENNLEKLRKSKSSSSGCKRAD